MARIHMLAIKFLGEYLVFENRKFKDQGREVVESTIMSIPLRSPTKSIKCIQIFTILQSVENFWLILFAWSVTARTLSTKPENRDRVRLYSLFGVLSL